MTQLSRERLEEIAELARKANYKPCAVHMTNLIAACDSEVIEKMARRLLAAEAHEPVAWIVHTRGGGQLTQDGDYVANAEGIGGIHATPLYAAPQPVAVPVVNLPSEFYSSEGVVVQLEKVMAALAVCGVKYKRKGNACLASMLNAEPVSQPYTLPSELLAAMEEVLRISPTHSALR